METITLQITIPADLIGRPMPEPEAPGREQTVTEGKGDDAQGFAAGAGRPGPNLIWQARPVLIPVIIRAFNPQPDPPRPAPHAEDVAGFMRRDNVVEGEPPPGGGGGPGAPTGSVAGGIMAMVDFATNPFGFIYQAITNPKRYY